MKRLFLDASYAIALATPADQHHGRAREFAAKIKKEGLRLVTTWQVMLEIGNFLARFRNRAAAIELIDAIMADPTIEVARIPDSSYPQAFNLYRNHSDKEWGLTDCLSFVVMKDRRLTAALTADRHFRQAGFEALLLEA